MFENDDFNLDESWFADHLPDETSILNSGTSTQNIYKPSAISASTSNLRSNKSENSTVEVNSPKKVVLKRKFPGPAGLFPEEANESTIFSHVKNLMHSDSFILSTQYLCSQNLNLTFQEPAWTDMCKDFEEQSTALSLLDKYNMEWITNSIPDNLINKRVPILAGIIKQIKSTSKSRIFVIADPTGELEALISPDLYEDLSEFLNVNSVLILKKCSILSINKYKHYLNITTDNLVRIYSCKDVAEDIKRVHIQKISNEDLVQEIINFTNKHKGEKYKDKHSVESFNKMDSIGTSKFINKSVLNNVTNKDCFKSNQYDKRCAGVIPKSNLNSEITNAQLLQTKQNCASSDNRNSDIINAAFQKESKSFMEYPSTSTNIFEQSNDFFDLDLRLDDLQKEFLPFENNCKEIPTDKYTIDSKKRKLDLHKSKPKTAAEPQNISNQLPSESESANLLRINLKNQRNTIDYSQISILTQNNENPDIIKEIFSDIDAAALFDEDF